MMQLARVACRLILYSLLLICSLSGISVNAKNTTTVKYRPSLGAASPSLDIYVGSNSSNAPVVVYVHGGAWQRGHRSRVGQKPSHFNRAGYLFVSIGYRLVPKVKVEDQLDDIEHGLQWVYDNIARYGGNKLNLHLMGHSAGAHLVAMTALSRSKSIEQLVNKGALRSIIANDTRAYDIPRLDKTGVGGQLHGIYQAAFGNDPARWRRLSPIYQVKDQRVIPAFLILYSRPGRQRYRKEFSEAFAQRLRGAGTTVTLFDGSMYSHREMTVRIGDDIDLTTQIDRFLRQHSGK